MIYTVDQQRERAEARRQRIAEDEARRAAAKDAAPVGGEEGGHLVVDGHDLTTYVRLAGMGVEWDKVVAGMEADGIPDAATKLQTALDRKTDLASE